MHSQAGQAALWQRVEALEAEVRALRAESQARLEEERTAPVVRLLEAGRLAEARQLVALLLQASPSPRLEQWARVLAPAVVREGEAATGTPFTRNAAWLRAHAAEYAGKWVALRDGELAGADESRIALHRRLEQSGSLKGLLFARL